MIRTPSLRAMELFATLMRTGSLTEAARRIGISQPAASLALKELEAQTGLALFIRSRRRLVPTPEGELLLPSVERLLAQAGNVDRQIEALRGGNGAAATIRVASIQTLSGTLLPTVISGLQRSRPELSIRIEVQSYAGVLELVRQEAVEIGFVNQPEIGGGGEAETLLTTWLACVMAPKHPLAGRPSVGVDALRRHAAILAAHGDLPAAALRRRLGLTGPDAAAGIDVNNVYTAMALAREGVGVALLSPLMLLTAQAHGLVSRPLETEIPLPMSALAPRGAKRGPAVSALLAEVRGAARAAVARLEALGMRASTP